MASKRKRFALDCIIAAIFIGAVTAGVYYVAQKRILNRAQQDIEHLILSHRGLHHYIQRVLHPTFFKAVDNGDIAKDYYAPEIFSSSYIVRTMHGFYNEELVKHELPEAYYNPANSVYAHKLLTKLGHTVVLAADGEKALQEWEQGNFDLILMDIQMPKMNGDEVVEIIRQREGKKHTPIIAVTAHAVIGDQKRLLEAGCDGYVSKPFTAETLVAEIKRVVG